MRRGKEGIGPKRGISPPPGSSGFELFYSYMKALREIGPEERPPFYV